MKISLNDTKHRKVIPVRVCVCVSLFSFVSRNNILVQVHSDCVRDVKVREDMLLTCSLDATLRVTDLRTYSKKDPLTSLYTTTQHSDRHGQSGVDV